MTEPLVSVLLPVRRWQAFTRAAVESLLTQTLANIEVLVIGHNDVHTLATQLPLDPRLRFLSRTEPGVVGASNTGLRQARGQWIARMDDDDIALPHRLQRQWQYLNQHPDIGLCGARVTLIDQNDSPAGIGLGNRRYESWLNKLVSANTIAEACFVENPLPNPTLFAHRDVWQRLGGYRDGDFPEDHDLVLRAWLDGIRMGKPEETLLHWREHAERITWHDPRYRREAFIRQKAATACDDRSGFGIGERHPGQRSLQDLRDDTEASCAEPLLHGRTASRPIWICGTGRNARYWFDALRSHQARVEGFVDLDRPGARRSKRHRPVITYEALWPLLESARLGSLETDKPFLISAISEPAARDALRAEFEAHGLICHVDFLMGG